MVEFEPLVGSTVELVALAAGIDVLPNNQGIETLPEMVSLTGVVILIAGAGAGSGSGKSKSVTLDSAVSDKDDEESPAVEEDIKSLFWNQCKCGQERSRQKTAWDGGYEVDSEGFWMSGLR